MRCNKEARGSHSGVADWFLAEVAAGQAYLGHASRGQAAVPAWSARLMV